MNPTGIESATGSEPLVAWTLRRAILIVFCLATTGVFVELLLLGHFEDLAQWLPLALLALGLVNLGWYASARSAASLRVFQLLTLLFVASGALGLYLHYQGNVEFELEMHPEMKGLRLIWGALTGATPALAPGTMIQLGLLGFAYTFQHPRLLRAPLPPITPEGTPR